MVRFISALASIPHGTRDVASRAGFTAPLASESAPLEDAKRPEKLAPLGPPGQFAERGAGRAPPRNSDDLTLARRPAVASGAPLRARRV